MIIASQHRWKDNEYEPHCAWPEDTLVQWGSKGLVISKEPYYTCFFEAFPSDKTKSGGFIRGEGDTIEAAEDRAFSKYLKEIACAHLWGRETYDNGGQLCRHCRAFRAGILKPVVKLGARRVPISKSEAWILETADEISDEASKPYIKSLKLRKSLFGCEG